jgi:hypothetical protein
MTDLQHVLSRLQGQGIPVVEAHLDYPEGETWEPPVWEGLLDGHRLRLVLSEPLKAAQVKAVEAWIASPSPAPRDEIRAALRSARDNWASLGQAERDEALRQLLLLVTEGR